MYFKFIDKTPCRCIIEHCPPIAIAISDTCFPRPCGIPRCIFPTSGISSSPCDIPRACQVDCCKMPSHPDNVCILIIPCPCKIPVLVQLIVELNIPHSSDWIICNVLWSRLPGSSIAQLITVCTCVTIYTMVVNDTTIRPPVGFRPNQAHPNPTSPVTHGVWWQLLCTRLGHRHATGQAICWYSTHTENLLSCFLTFNLSPLPFLDRGKGKGVNLTW